MKKFSKKELIKKLKELGLTNIHLTYKKSEGWWLTCDTFDDWIGMDSFGAMITIENEFKKA